MDQDYSPAAASPAEVAPSRGDQPESVASWHTAGPRRAGLRWLVVLLVLGLVAVPWLIYEVPREIARWYVAAALEKHLDGDLQGAFGSLDRATDWDPANAALYRQRADWKLDAKDFSGSLEDCQRAVELAPDDAANYVQRSQLLQHLGRHEEAIQDWDKIVELSRGSNLLPVKSFHGTFEVSPYNGRAYARAVGDMQLTEALDDIERAIQHKGPDPSFLDTRGLIYYLRGDLDKARQDLDEAVETVEQWYQQWTARLAAGKPHDDGPADDGRRQHVEVDLRVLNETQQQLENHLAVILYHRSLVYDKLRLGEQAEKDRQRVKDLGYEPDASLF